MKKTYLIKSFRILLVLPFFLFSQSCKTILDEKVISDIGNDYINTHAGFEAAVNATYASQRIWYGTEAGLTMSEYGTDLYRAGADGSYKGFHFYDTQLTPAVDILSTIWNELYKGINTANAVIERAPKVAGFTDALKAQRVAEVKFLRAHYYFLLTEIWGGVDLRLTETLAPTKKTARATETDMYKAIIADLTAALPALENKSASSDYGRATKAAAEFLLAKVYLTKATSSAKETSDYANAATYAQNVISNYSFKLMPDFASVFIQGGGEVYPANSEVVYSVQYTSDPLTNADGNSLHLYFGMQYDVQAGMVRDIANGRPFKRLRPTTYTTDVVFQNRVDDSRYQKTYKDTWICNNPGTYTNVFDNSKASVTFKAGDTTIFIPGYEMSLADRAKRKYQVLVPSLYSAALFPTLQKFLDPNRPDKTYTNGSRDYLCFRLADAYLIVAEAQLQQGNAAAATTAINNIRRRAAWAGHEAAMLITSDKMTMDFLMEERARELAGEQTRWFDLKRWGNLVDRVKKYNPDAPNIQSFHNLRPIPQPQIDRSDGTSTAFPQNPGY